MEKLCLICAKTFTFTSIRKGKTRSVKVNNDIDTLPQFPGTSSSGTCLNRHLWSVYFLRGVLLQTKNECDPLLRKTFGVNPGWWFRLCTSCADALERMYKLQLNILKLERDVQDLQQCFLKNLKNTSKTDRRRDPFDKTLLRVREVLKGGLPRIGTRKIATVERIFEDCIGQFLLVSNDEEDVSNDAPRDPVAGADDDVELIDLDNDDGNRSKLRHLRRKRRRPTPQKSSYVELSDDDDNAMPVDEKSSDENDDDPIYCPDEEEVVELTSRKTSAKSNDSSRQVVKKLAKESSSKEPQDPHGDPDWLPCPICPYRFETSVALQRHSRHHEIFKDFTCPECNYPTVSEKLLKRHLRIIHKKRNRKLHEYKCERCDLVIPRTSKQAKFTHQRLHIIEDNIEVQEGSDMVKCKICSENLEGRVQIKKHFQEKHGSELGLPSPHVCETCGKTFVTLSVLQKHVREVHLNEKRFGCEICGDRFTSRKLLDNHAWSHKPAGQNTLMCDTCGLEYKNPRGLQIHRRVFHWVPKATTRNTGLLGRHLTAAKDVSRRNTEVSCTQCGITVLHRKALKLHLKSAHIDLYKYSCNQCGAKYMSSSSLKVHIHAMHLTATVKCPNCPSVFRCEEYMKSHMKTYCNKKFIKSSSENIQEMPSDYEPKCELPLPVTSEGT